MSNHILFRPAYPFGPVIPPYFSGVINNSRQLCPRDIRLVTVDVFKSNRTLSRWFMTTKIIYTRRHSTSHCEMTEGFRGVSGLRISLNATLREPVTEEWNATTDSSGEGKHKRIFTSYQARHNRLIIGWLTYNSAMTLLTEGLENINRNTALRYLPSTTLLSRMKSMRVFRLRKQNSASFANPLRGRPDESITWLQFRAETLKRWYLRVVSQIFVWSDKRILHPWSSAIYSLDSRCTDICNSSIHAHLFAVWMTWRGRLHEYEILKFRRGHHCRKCERRYRETKVKRRTEAQPNF